jgi:hypothetical protein
LKKPDFIPSALTGWIGLAGFVHGCGLAQHLRPVVFTFSILGGAHPHGLHLGADVGARRAGCCASSGEGGGPVDGITKQRDYSFARTGMKLVGLLATIALLALLYWIFPEYNPSLPGETSCRGPRLLQQFFHALPAGRTLGAGCVRVYFFFVDARLNDPRDGYWHFGACRVVGVDGIDWAKVRNHLRTWAVKGFFMPLMFTFLCTNLAGLHWHDEHAAALKQSFFDGSHGGRTIWPCCKALFNYCNNFIFSIDLAFVACGYVLTLRLVQSHVRSAEPTDAWLDGGFDLLPAVLENDWRSLPRLLVRWGLAVQALAEHSTLLMTRAARASWFSRPSLSGRRFPLACVFPISRIAAL